MLQSSNHKNKRYGYIQNASRKTCILCMRSDEDASSRGFGIIIWLDACNGKLKVELLRFLI